MVTLIEKYIGEGGRESLVEALRDMVLVRNSRDLAAELAEHVHIDFTSAGSTLIEEGAEGSDMYFLLSGRLQVIVREREYALLRPGAHVGEFSLVDPGALRSATVRALEDSVTARLSEEAFAEVANRHPELWRSVSQVLGSHLRAGNRFLKPSNPRPRVLICASPVGWPFAQAIKAFATDCEHQSEAWTVEAICPEDQDSPEALEEAFAGADLGVIVIAPGDADSAGASRDRVFHYCGIGVGSLGRTRTLLLEPGGLGDQSPATALGLTCFTYRLDPPEAIKADLDSICRTLRQAIPKVGSK
jgi:predicted nucleotide-binding protein